MNFLPWVNELILIPSVIGKRNLWSTWKIYELESRNYKVLLPRIMRSDAQSTMSGLAYSRRGETYARIPDLYRQTDPIVVVMNENLSFLTQTQML